MERLFQILAVVLAFTAAYFFWRGYGDYAFVSFVLAVSAFFLAYRFRLKKRLAEQD